MMQYKPLEKNLEEGVSQLGNQIKSMPHIIIGGNKKTHTNNGGDAEPSIPPSDIFSPKDNERINNAKKWGLIISVLVVIIYALYRILRGFF